MLLLANDSISSILSSANARSIIKNKEQLIRQWAKKMRLNKNVEQFDHTSTDWGFHICQQHTHLPSLGLIVVLVSAGLKMLGISWMKSELISYVSCLTLKRQEGVISSYLLPGYDVICILKLCIEERDKAECFCAV